MAEYVIEVKNLCKQFTIDHHKGNPDKDSVRASVAAGVKKAVRLRRDRMLTPSKKEEVFQALNNISFSIEKGQRVGIIGRNGAGKSTLLKILSKISEPTSGTVAIKGKVVSLLEVGTGFHPELSGRENIFLNGVILGMKRSVIRSRLDDIVAFSEIGAFLDTPVKRYSSGMYMRLAFAIAVHMEPDILILDEMLAVGDAQFQRKCLAKMEEICKTGERTILFVSHSIEAVTAFCNQGIYLEGGTLIAQGGIEDVVHQYMSKLQDGADLFQPHTDRAVFFNQLSLKSKDISLGGNIVLRLQIMSTMEHPAYLIGLSIGDIVDTKVASNIVWIDEPLRKGLNELTLTIPTANMVPGDYTLNISVALDKQLENIDVVLAYPSFSVKANPKSGTHQDEVLQRWSRNWGSHILSGITFEHH
jgi:lipopolysaccharide transport system ATP-binding protein